MLADRGVMDIAAEELSVPPGMDELFSLLQIKRHHDSGDYDAVIVDCAPTGETLRLLGFPDIANWWLEKVFPWERRLLAAAKPIARMVDVQIPGEDVIAEVQKLVRQLIAMNEILRDRQPRVDPAGDDAGPDGRQGGAANVHLPQPLRLSDRRGDRQQGLSRGARPSATSASGASASSVAWRRSRPDSHRFRSSPRVTSATRSWDPTCSIASATEIFADELDPAAVLHTELTHEIESANGSATLRIAVPFGERGDVSLKKVGPELIVSVGPRKRTIILPTALARRSPTGAKLRDGSLEVSFATKGADHA